MARRIRVGVAGCGKIARATHVPSLLNVPGVEVAALCDNDKKRTANIKELYGLDTPTFTRFDDMLQAGLDAVCLCTPNDLHVPMAHAAFKAGLHVLCEKPMAATLPEATRMIAAAKKAGRVLHINQSMRYSAPYVTAAELVAKGRIGQPVHARCIRAAGTTPDQRWSPGAKWFVSKKRQGGLILDIAIHMADVLQWFVGDVDRIASLVHTRNAKIDVPDNVSSLFQFKKGATGVLELSWTLPTGAGMLEVYGSEGSLRMGFSEQPLELKRIVNGKPKTTFPKVKRGVKNSFECFAMAIRGKAPSPTSGEMGRDALALCDAIVRSGASGRFVKVKRF